MGNPNDEVDTRFAIGSNIGSNIRREIVFQLRDLLHEHNELVNLFKIALDRMPSDDYKIIIRPDKMPQGEHPRRFNAPVIDEVSIVMVGEVFQSRDIVLHRRNNQLLRVSETHRCYDALQYPLLFCRGEDGYHLQLKMVNPITGMYLDIIE